MNPLKSVSHLIARSRTLENCLVSAGQRWPRSRIVLSLCYHTGARINFRDPSATRIVRLPDGTRLSLMLNEGIFRHIYFTGEYEPETTRLISGLARPGQTWLDVGANIGYLTLLLSRRVGPSGRVHAFEPNIDLTTHLETSLKLNSATNVDLVRKAVSDTSGQEITFFIPEGEHSNTVRGSVIRFRDINHVREVRVPTITLDDYLDQTGAKPQFVKIDIEGFEISAFRGFQKTLRASPPLVILSELNQFPEVAAPPQEIIEFLAAFGYRPYKMRVDGLFPHVMGEPVDAADMNYAFVQESAIELIEPFLAAQLH